MNFLKFMSNKMDMAVDDDDTRIKYKIRDDMVRVNGRQFANTDLICFRVKDRNFVPKFATADDDKDIVVNMLPYLCVGMAEILANEPLVSHDSLTAFEACLGWDLNCDIEDFVKVIYDFQHASIIEDELLLSRLTSMQCPYASRERTSVNRVVSKLYALAFLDSRAFLDALLSVVQYSILYDWCFIFEKASFKDGPELQAEDNFSDPEFRRFGALKIDDDDSESEKKMTDARGIGIRLIYLLQLYLYGDLLHKDFLFPDKVETCIKRTNSQLRRCFGNDLIGSFFIRLMSGDNKYVDTKPLEKSQTGKYKYNKKDELSNFIYFFNVGLSERGVFYGNDTTRFDDSSIGKYGTVSFMHMCVDEDNPRLDDATGDYDTQIDYLEKRYPDPISMIGLSFHYCNVQDVIASVGFFISRQQVNALMKPELDLQKKVTDLENKSVSKDKEKGYLSKIKDLESRLEIADLKVANFDTELKEQSNKYEALLEQKNDIIKGLSEQIAILEYQVNNTFSDSDFDSESEDADGTVENVSLEDKIAFLNDFHLLIVGGHYSTNEKLIGLGMNNYTIVTKISEASGKAADFICICTNFVAHKVTRRVSKLYSDQLDTLFYYNGINANYLVDAYYQFAKKFLEEGDNHNEEGNI